MSTQTLFYGRVSHIHFVGIGGIGMSGIAEVVIGLGFHVSGSDLKTSVNTRHLESLGAKVVLGHAESNIEGADVVVISSDIQADNPEVRAAHAIKVPVIARAQMLAELMRLQHGIAVAGSHGKTTTTSLVATVLQYAGLDPTVVIGGRVNQLGSNARLGQGKFLVAEADESDGSFTRLSPSIAVLTNLDEEHLNYWTGGITQIKQAFLEFINRLPFFGLFVGCIDAEHVRALLPHVNRRFVTYGINHVADYQAKDIVHDGLTTYFTFERYGQMMGRVRLQLVGTHNVQNALSVFAIADEVGIPFQIAKEGLEAFRGVQRRFTLVGEAGGVTVIDDYGHHPTEIKAVLAAARNAFQKRRLVVLFQPHRYTRTQHLLDDFAQSFDQADQVILTDIYSAGELAIEGISSETIAAKARAFGNPHVEYGGNLDNATMRVLGLLKPQDVVITLGAGTITQAAPKLVEALSR